ncbi:MAG TPA: hypothetical protein VFV35_01090 [Acidimicrobiales bacterium]|nr:hypothetical protein [Acidimicrobiales bacterium]
MRRGCYPGSFDPLTLAHLAIAEAARAQCALDVVDLVLPDGTALGKDRHHQSVEARVAAIETAAASDRPWLRAVVRRERLLADIASGYDVLLVGADKWAQVVDVAFYGTEARRDEAVARLPHVAWAPRGDLAPPAGVTVLSVPAWIGDVSSTAVRAGATRWRAT